MQTVGHVSGATHFYSRQQLQNDPFPKDKVRRAEKNAHLVV